MPDTAASPPLVKPEELLDVLSKSGEKTGVSKPRGAVHRDGDYHRAVHVWIFAESTQELLLQKRASRDSWPEVWDISSAGHVSAGESSLTAARREVHEELGIILPTDAFELLFVYLQERLIDHRNFIDNEHEDVYLITIPDPFPLQAFTLEEAAICDVKYIHYEEYRKLLGEKHPDYLPHDVNGGYGKLFDIIKQRYDKPLQ